MIDIRAFDWILLLIVDCLLIQYRGILLLVPRDETQER